MEEAFGLRAIRWTSEMVRSSSFVSPRGGRSQGSWKRSCVWVVAAAVAALLLAAGEVIVDAPLRVDAADDPLANINMLDMLSKVRLRAIPWSRIECQLTPPFDGAKAPRDDAISGEQNPVSCVPSAFSPPLPDVATQLRMLN